MLRYKFLAVAVWLCLSLLVFAQTPGPTTTPAPQPASTPNLIFPRKVDPDLERLYEGQPVQNLPQLQEPDLQLEEVRIKGELFDLATQNFFRVYRTRLEDMIRARVDLDVSRRNSIDPFVLSELVNLYARRALDTENIERETVTFFRNRLFQRFGDMPRAQRMAISWAEEVVNSWQDRIVEALLPELRARYRAKTEGTLERFGQGFFDRQEAAIVQSVTSTGGSPGSLTSSEIPPRDTYLLRPGDQVRVVTYNLQGGQTESSVALDGNGVGYVEGLGPVSLAGQTVNQAEQSLSGQIASRLPNFRVRVSLEAATRMRVFVVGEARRPGAYLVSPGSTALDALLLAGGPTSSGTFRNIKLQRAGATVSTIDLYAILVKGNFQAAGALKDGDRIFIPTRGPEVAVIGQVLRPALYELKNEKTLRQVLTLAGGIESTAYSPSVSIERADQNRARILEDVSLAKADRIQIQGGDKVEIKSLLPEFSNGVYIEGAVLRPGWYSLKQNPTVSALLARAQGLQERPVARLATIYRSHPGRPIQILTFDVLQAIAGDPASNVALQPRDRVVIEPEEKVAVVTRKVLVRGEVKIPGEYDRFEGMRVSDLLAAAGGTTPEASTEAEIARTGPNGQVIIMPLALPLAMNEPSSVNNEVLQDQDMVIIRRVANARRYPATIAVLGQVAKPGDYPFETGSNSLRAVLTRAGGVLPTAYPKGAVLIRRVNEIVPLRDRTAAQDVFETVQEVEREFALADALRNGGSSAAEVLSQRRTTTPTASVAGITQGLQNLDTSSTDTIVPARVISRILSSERVPLNFQAIMAGETDFLIKDGDILYIPEQSSTVVVSGAVNLPTALPYTPGFRLDDYIARAGGFSPDANEDKVLVYRADGVLLMAEDSKAIEPGDLILVPPRAIVSNPSFWDRFIQILQIGVNGLVLSRILQ